MYKLYSVFYLLVSFVFILSGFVAWTDLRTQHVPVALLQLGIFIAAGLNTLFLSMSLFSIVIGAVSGYLFLFIPYHFSHGRLVGKGDAWVGAWMGAVLGFPGILLGLYVTMLIGGVIGIGLLCCGWKRTKRIPFAPILCGGLIIALLAKTAVFAWLQV